MSLSGRLAMLALGVSALPFAAYAESSTEWVYGIDSRDVSAVGDVQATAARRPRRTPPPPPPPPPPAPPAGSIIVGIVDTGIDLDHPEFVGRIAAGGACFGAAAACTGLAAQGDDNNGHGTHVAGIVGAAANGVGNTGVAPNALLLPVKVLDANGSGSFSAVASGISYAASRGARVINLSLGGDSASTTLLAPLRQAATTSVIVAAAGNGGNALSPGYPAAYATQAGIVGSMIIVGSVNAQNSISSFSQTPGNGGCVAVSGVTRCFKDVFLVAPGQSIFSTYPGGGYASMSGTSMATPYVSGVAARVLAASPYLTPQQVVSILLQSATDIGAAGVDAIYGRGLVNLQAALAPLGAQSVAISGASTSSYAGTGSVGGAGVSGILAAGLHSSSIMKDLVFFDSFGRDYRTDLSHAISNGALSFGNLLAEDGQFRSVAFVGESFSVSGLVSDASPNPVAFAGAAGMPGTVLSDVVMTARLSENASVTVGRDASLSGRLNILDLAASEAYDGLFMSATAMNSPFLGLTEGATFAAGQVAVGGGLTLGVAHARTSDEDARFADGVLSAEEALSYLAEDRSHLRSAENTALVGSWRFASWGVAGFTAVRTREDNSLLGTFEQGALALTASAETTSIGFGTRFSLGDDWVMSGSWSRGHTEAAPSAGSLFQSLSDIESEAYGLALSKRGVFGESDTIGFAITRPLHITRGSAVITASTGVTEEREILYSNEVVDLASRPETDYEVGYTATLGDGLSMQASAIYQQDVAGQAGESAVAGFATLKATW